MLKAKKWDKRKIHSLLLEALKAERDAILYAATTAKEGATHEDAVAKSKYDTHGLELSYLAGSQFERARQAETKIALLENTLFQEFDEDDPIDVGALVTVRGQEKQDQQVYLISNIGAGLSITWEESRILVISPESPLGEALLSLGVGDELPLRSPSRLIYEIIALA